MAAVADSVLGYRKPAAGEEVWLPVYLSDAAGAAVTGVAYDAAGMAVAVAKPGAAYVAWATIVGSAFTADNWAEIGYGYYAVILSGDVEAEANLLDTPGDVLVYCKTTGAPGGPGGNLFRCVTADALRENAAGTRAAFIDVATSSREASGAAASAANTIRGGVETLQTLAEAIAAVGGGSGASTVTVTVTDDSAAVLEGLRVTVHNEAEDDPGIVQTTDADGEAVFGLADGDYHVVVSSSPAYTPTNPYALTVDGATALTCEVEARVPPVPSDPDYCVVEAWPTGHGGTDPSCTLSVVRIHSAPADGRTVVLDPDDDDDTSGATGYCALTIRRGAVVTLQLTRADGTVVRTKGRVTVPDADSANWETGL